MIFMTQRYLQNNSDCIIVINVILYIGIGRFRILGGRGGGGQGLEYWGGWRARGGGANSQQAHDVVTTSMRRNDVTLTSFQRHVPIRFVINQCQIITFFILKYGIIDNLPVPSNQIKVTFYCYFTLQLGIFVIFSCFT